MTVLWPRDLLKPMSARVDPAPATIGGPASLSGFRQSVSSPAGVWMVTLEGVVVASVAQRNTMRALAAQVEGRATPLVLPVYDRDDLRPLGVATATETGYDDGADHSDGTGLVTGRVQFQVSGAVARGAVQMVATKILGADLQAGHQFSIGHRLYRIKSIDAVSGADTTITVWPPAREAIVDGAEMDFDRPVVKCRLLDDRALDLALDHGRHGFVTFSAIEDPT